MIIYYGPNRRRISQLLDENRVTGYTDCGTVHGAGATGRHEGTRAWPGSSELIFTVVEETKLEELLAALRGEVDRLRGDERLHAAVLPTETFF